MSIDLGGEFIKIAIVKVMILIIIILIFSSIYMLNDIELIIKQARPYVNVQRPILECVFFLQLPAQNGPMRYGAPCLQRVEPICC